MVCTGVNDSLKTSPWMWYLVCHHRSWHKNAHCFGFSQFILRDYWLKIRPAMGRPCSSGRACAPDTKGWVLSSRSSLTSTCSPLLPVIIYFSPLFPVDPPAVLSNTGTKRLKFKRIAVDKFPHCMSKLFLKHFFYLIYNLRQWWHWFISFKM